MGRLQKKRVQKVAESDSSDSSKPSCSTCPKKREVLNGRIQKLKTQDLKPKKRASRTRGGVEKSHDSWPVENREVPIFEHYEDLTASFEPDVHPVVSIDCEMVGTGSRSMLAKCSILDYDGRILYDEYIRPDRRITDYRTKWSGIKPCHMKTAQPYGEATERIKGILRGSIVVGHDLTHDFAVIGLQHPKTCIRDTAKFVPLRGLAGLIKTHNPSLKNLTAILLGRTIQNGAHCSLEDARAALDIYRKYEDVWEEYLRDRTFWFQDKFWPKDVCHQI